jgi:hypothetical protein
MAIAAELVHNGTFSTGDDATFISLGDAGQGKVCTMVVQITGTWAATLIFEGTLGTPGTGTYVVLGYTASTDRGTVVTAGTTTANGIFYVIADGLSDVRIRPSIEGTGTIAVRRRAIYG